MSNPEKNQLDQPSMDEDEPDLKPKQPLNGEEGICLNADQPSNGKDKPDLNVNQPCEDKLDPSTNQLSNYKDAQELNTSEPSNDEDKPDSNTKQPANDDDETSLNTDQPSNGEDDTDSMNIFCGLFIGSPITVTDEDHVQNNSDNKTVSSRTQKIEVTKRITSGYSSSIPDILAATTDLSHTNLVTMHDQADGDIKINATQGATNVQNNTYGGKQYNVSGDQTNIETQHNVKGDQTNIGSQQNVSGNQFTAQGNINFGGVPPK